MPTAPSHRLTAVRRPTARALAGLSLWLSLLASTSAESVEGFTEPFRRARLSCAESGLVAELLIHEGQAVTAGQLLARLDSTVHQALLKVADAGRQARAEIEAAEIELKQRQRQRDILAHLRGDQYASARELELAETALETAQAQLQAALERQQLRQLEYDKLAAQLEARQVPAPWNGVVVSLAKQVGEYVGPTDPVILEMVELDPLWAVFLAPRDIGARVATGVEVRVGFTDLREETPGRVEFVSPLTDAESGTIMIKVRVANPEGRWRAGEACHLHLGPLGGVAQRPAPSGTRPPARSAGVER